MLSLTNWTSLAIPPSRISMRYPTPSLYLGQRFRQVVLHYIWKRCLWGERSEYRNFLHVPVCHAVVVFSRNMARKYCTATRRRGTPRAHPNRRSIDILHIWDRHEKTI